MDIFVNYLENDLCTNTAQFPRQIGLGLRCVLTRPVTRPTDFGAILEYGVVLSVEDESPSVLVLIMMDSFQLQFHRSRIYRNHSSLIQHERGVRNELMYHYVFCPGVIGSNPVATTHPVETKIDTKEIIDKAIFESDGIWKPSPGL